MASITLELVLGDDQETYDNLVAALPLGDNNLKRGIVVPSHPQNLPQTFKIGGLTAGKQYVVDVQGEWQTPPKPRAYFAVPTTLTSALGSIVLVYSALLNGDTVTIDGTTFTAVTGIAAINQFRIEVDAYTTANNLVDAINTNLATSAIVEASSSLASMSDLAYVRLMARIPGSQGNLYTLSSSTVAITVPASLGGGADETRTSGSLTSSLTIALPYGPVTMTIWEANNEATLCSFLLSVVNYAVLFRSYAQEITQYSKLPLQQLEESIASPLSFRLATPMLVGLTNLIPADLETLAALAYKLLVKNLLHTPGTLGATTEILAAFSASNPIFFKMLNINKFDSPMYRSEEVFQGYEAHVWLPNNEVERWKAFIQLLNNLPQLYTIKQITEGEVYVQQGGKMRRHLFDFDSPLANSITTGLAYLTDCFLRLFTLNVSVETEHYLAFCQASYILDQLIANALSPTDADPLAVTPWSSFSLSGRIGQQFDITSIHEWYYDTPLKGEVDGVNRYYRLTKFPISTAAVKVFVDGLLRRLYIDYRISLSGNIISNAYRILSMPYGPLLVSVNLGEPRPFYAPVFSSLEVRGNAPLQMLLTGVEQDLSHVSFVISHRPTTVPTDPQAVAVHFVTPKLANSGLPGENQYGQIAMTAGISSYALTFNQPTVSIDYQLLISLTVNPMPSSDPTLVQQVVHIVREHTYTGATIEFSSPLAPDVKLNWWVIEDDSLILERGTLLLSDGMSLIPIIFVNGPYFDQVVVLLQLWEINPTFTDAAQYLVSSMAVGPGGTIVRFSAPIDGDNYRLDYVIFPARGGDFVEFFEPQMGLIEAHYDVKWSRWINAGLSPSPDGIRTEFTLPYPPSDPKSIYLAIDGRLLTQGANHQYTVQGDTVTFTFPPTYEQSLWSVYPVTNPAGEELASKWDQSFLNYLPASGGEYATGWIKASGAITVGDTVSVDGLAFEATRTSRGSLTNSNIINIGSFVTWNSLGVTLTGVADATLPRGTLTNTTIMTLGSSVTWQALGVTLVGVASSPSNQNQFKVGMSIDLDAAALMVAINTHSVLSLSYTASYLASGVLLVLGKISGGFETLTSTGSITATDIAFDENYFTVGISKDADTASLVSAINAHSILSLYYEASSPLSGFTLIEAKALGGGFYNETLTAFGFSGKINITGDVAPSSYNSYTIYLGEHTVSVTSTDVDTTANAFSRDGHPYYEGLGVTVITTGTLPSPLAVATNYYIVNPTTDTFQLALTPYGTPIDITTQGIGYHTFSSLDVDIADSAFSFPTSIIPFSGILTSGSPIVTSILPSTSNLAVGMAITGTNIPANTIIKSIDYANQLTLNANALGAGLTSFIAENIFRENEDVRFITQGSLPTGLTSGQTYYVRNITQNRFKVSAAIDGSPVAFTSGGIGEFVVYSVPRFASGLNQSLDLAALANEIQKHPITSSKVTTSVGDGLITVTAKKVGARGNYPLAVTGDSMTSQGLSSGRDPSDTSYATSKLCYYYDAPVTTLDGLSTRLWKQYGGDEFLFTYSPILKQEGYYISEVYPIDHHPLDSTVANLPCNYPKGVFTQGFGTHFNETEVVVDQPGTLVIATANLPVQEQPDGLVNGINTVFTITYTSCGGQNSMMLWLDGIFQPSDKYTYTDMGSYGKITMLTPPAVGQELWAWYLPLGTACFDERVNALVGSIDGVNQTFDVPDSPWTDAPSLVAFLEGLFVLQGQDYSVISGNTQIQFMGTLTPASGQSLWGHYNLGSVIPVDNWRQIYVGTTDGILDTFMIPHLLTSELPTSVDSVLVFLNGLNQGGKFVVEVDGFGNPTGNIIFTGGSPEANRRLDVAYIR